MVVATAHLRKPSAAENPLTAVEMAAPSAVMAIATLSTASAASAHISISRMACAAARANMAAEASCPPTGMALTASAASRLTSQMTSKSLNITWNGLRNSVNWHAICAACA